MSRSNTNIQERITVDDIMRATNNGEDVFRREISNFTLTTNISSPFHVDNNPSFRLKRSRTSGIYTFTDYTTGKKGNAITFVRELYHLTFPEAINKIAWDFGLRNNQGSRNLKRIEIEQIDKPIIDSKPILYEFEQMKFKKTHHAYWNPGELYEEYLNNNNVFAASKIAVNKRVIKIPDDELCFVYDPDDINGLKILRIGRNVDNKDKWRTNIPNTYLWDYSKYENNKIDGNLWVLKSRKDQLVMNLLGIETISVQSENMQILDVNMERILPLADNIVISFGSDADGVKKCKAVQQKYKTLYYNTPRNVLGAGINDQFSYVSTFGLKALEKHIKSKKL